MKKTILALALASGMLATAQADITATWTATDLASGKGTLTVPTTATTGAGNGNFTLTAVLDINEVKTRLTNNNYGLILGFHSASTTTKGFGVTINGTSTGGGLYAEKADAEGVLNTSDNAAMGDPMSVNLEATLNNPEANYVSMAFTMMLDNTGFYGMLTLKDEDGELTNYGVKV